MFKRNPIINYFIIIIFHIVWFLCFISIGIPDIFIILGGSVELFFILPIIIILSFKFKPLPGLLLGFILTLAGIILINYLYSYFLNIHKMKMMFIVIPYILILPAFFIIFGYAFTLFSIIGIKKNNLNIKEEDRKELSYFTGYFMACFSIPLSFVLAFLFNYKEGNNILLIGYEIVLGSMLMSSLVLFYELRKVPKKTLLYYRLVSFKFNTNLKKVKKYIVVIILVIVAFSFTSEFTFRKQWIIWFETIAIFAVYILFLFEIVDILCMPAAIEENELNSDRLPSIKSKRNIITIGVLTVIYLILYYSMKLF